MVGLGARGGALVAQLRAAVDSALGVAGVAAADVTLLATVDRRAKEEGVRSLALDLDWRLVGLPAAELAGQAVPTPSARVERALGTGSVAEAAALITAGPKATLVLPKLIIDGVTIAIASAGE